MNNQNNLYSKKRSDIISGVYEPKKEDLPLDFEEQHDEKKRKQ